MSSKLMSWLAAKVKKVNEVLTFSGAPGASPSGETRESQDPPIDESLPALEMVKRYGSSPYPSHRAYVMRNLGSIGEQLGHVRAKEVLLRLVESHVSDRDPTVREALAEGVVPFGSFILNFAPEADYTNVVLHVLLPLVAELTTDVHPQARGAAVNALVHFARLMRHDDLLPYLVPIVKSLSRDRTAEEHRVQAANLFPALSPVLGPSICRKYVISFVENLVHDPVFRVRKAVALQMPKMIPVLSVRKEGAHSGEPAQASPEPGSPGKAEHPGEDGQGGDNEDDDDDEALAQAAFSRLVAACLALSEDDIWGVRKACCASLIALAEHSSSHDVRQHSLAPAFTRLASDSSRWVRGTALRSLGPFIATFGPESGNTVPPSLFQNFLAMGPPAPGGEANASVPAHYKESDASLYCAHAFPAVLLTMGTGYWDTHLGPLHRRLADDRMGKVRRSLACSLHVVAHMLGPEVADRDLARTFEAFLSDLDEVRSGVWSNMARFLAALSPDARQRYVYLLREHQQQQTALVHGEAVGGQMRKTSAWRQRRLLAHQIGTLSTLFVEDTLFDVVVPLGMALCRDSVSAVRDVAVPEVASLLLTLLGGEGHAPASHSTTTTTLHSSASSSPASEPDTTWSPACLPSDRHRAVLASVQGLVHGSHQDRMSFVGLCDHLLSLEESFGHDRKPLASSQSPLLVEHHHALPREGQPRRHLLPGLWLSSLLPGLCCLTQDRVPNVRLAVGAALARHAHRVSHAYGRDRMTQMLEEMRAADPDHDVRHAAGAPWQPFPERVKPTTGMGGKRFSFSGVVRQGGQAVGVTPVAVEGQLTGVAKVEPQPGETQPLESHDDDGTAAAADGPPTAELGIAVVEAPAADASSLVEPTLVDSDDSGSPMSSPPSSPLLHSRIVDEVDEVPPLTSPTAQAVADAQDDEDAEAAREGPSSPAQQHADVMRLAQEAALAALPSTPPLATKHDHEPVPEPRPSSTSPDCEEVSLAALYIRPDADMPEPKEGGDDDDGAKTGAGVHVDERAETGDDDPDVDVDMESIGDDVDGGKDVGDDGDGDGDDDDHNGDGLHEA